MEWQGGPLWTQSGGLCGPLCPIRTSVHASYFNGIVHKGQYRAGSQDTLDDAMGADFDQLDAAQVGVRAAGLALRQATKGGGVGWGIIDVLQGAIDGHQLQAKGEGPRSVIDLRGFARV